jgi:Uma2 family endonuclease
MSNVMSARAEDTYRRHPLTVADYHRMGEAGMFAPDARVELIEGEVIDVATIGTRADPRFYEHYRFTVGDFNRMGEIGVLARHARVELIDGEVIDMAPIGSKHAASVAELVRRFVLAAGRRAIVWCQSPIVLGEFDEPQPDIALLRPRDDGYSTGLPRPEDVFLVVEIADTTLRYDRDIKLAVYARASVAEVWIVDLEKPALYVYRNAVGDGYAQREEYLNPGIIAPAAAADLVVDLSRLF